MTITRTADDHALPYPVVVKAFPTQAPDYLFNAIEPVGEGILHEDGLLSLQLHIISVFLNAAVVGFRLALADGRRLELPGQPSGSPAVAQAFAELPWAANARFVVDGRVRLPEGWQQQLPVSIEAQLACGGAKVVATVLVGDGPARQPQPPAMVRPPGLLGRVDAVTDGVIKGWAAHTHGQQAPVALGLYVDGQYVARTEANLYRADLTAIPAPQPGFLGFELDIPKPWQDGLPHRFVVMDLGTAQVLAGVDQFCLLDGDHNRQRLPLIYDCATLAVQQGEVAATAKVAIVSTYFEHPHFSLAHLRLFASLKALGYWVLCAHAANGQQMRLARPESVDCLLVKRNLGYDFGSWLVGIQHLLAVLPTLEQMLLINDSVIGPLGELGRVVEAMAAHPYDFWGMTDSFELNYHLQSYFLAFNQPVLRSGFFSGLGGRFSFANDRELAIKEGELCLTNKLAADGFRHGAAFQYEKVAAHWLNKWQAKIAYRQNTSPAPADGAAAANSLPQAMLPYVKQVLSGEPKNPTLFFWDSLIEMGFPFIKRELIHKNPFDLPNVHMHPALIAKHCPNFPMACLHDASRFFTVAKVYV